MGNVKPIILKSNGSKAELGAFDLLTIPVVDSEPLGSPPVGFVWLFINPLNNHLYQKDSDGVLLDLSVDNSLKEVEIDFGPIVTSSAKFIVPYPGVVPTSKILISPSGNKADNRGSDDWLWDSIQFAAYCTNNDEIIIHAHTNTSVAGKRKIYISVTN
jgi:hypothetical protein